MKTPKQLKIPPEEDFSISDDPEVFIKEILKTINQPRFFNYQEHLNEFLD
jgi:hypothetical protein